MSEIRRRAIDVYSLKLKSLRARSEEEEEEEVPHYTPAEAGSRKDRMIGSLATIYIMRDLSRLLFYPPPRSGSSFEMIPTAVAASEAS